jgi:hypothetical protein
MSTTTATTALTTTRERFAIVSQVVQETASERQHAISIGDKFTEALVVADGLRRLREGFSDEVIASISALSGTSLGFRHDMEGRGSGNYPPTVIRDCAIEALVRGLSLTGNQFNIIAARCYVTREGYSALLAGYPGLTNLEVEIGLPEDGKPFGKQELVYVTAAAKCKLNGNPVSVECRKTDDFDGRLAVKTFAGEIDNAKGKATRRVLKLLYERITGSVIDEPDDGVETAGKVQVIEQPAKPAATAITETTIEQWSKERAALTTDEARQYWDDMSESMQVAGLQQIAEDLAKRKLATKDRESLRRWFTHRKQQLAGVE